MRISPVDMDLHFRLGVDTSFSFTLANGKAFHVLAWLVPPRCNFVNGQKQGYLTWNLASGGTLQLCRGAGNRYYPHHTLCSRPLMTLGFTTCC